MICRCTAIHDDAHPCTCPDCLPSLARAALAATPRASSAADREWEVEPKPDHKWNDPDEDGHDCADCAPDSMWKCDRFVHLLGGMRSAYDLLSPEQQSSLADELAKGAAVRRRGGASAGTIPLGAALRHSPTSETPPAPRLDVDVLAEAQAAIDLNLDPDDAASRRSWRETPAQLREAERLAAEYLRLSQPDAGTEGDREPA
jgi:hypothetical protein